MSTFKKIAAFLICLTMTIVLLSSCDEILQGTWDTREEQELQEDYDLEYENDTEKDSTTTKLESSTEKTESSTTKPENSTTKPESSTTKPESSTTKPESSTTKPENSTTKPESSTTKPESSTTKPENSTSNNNNTTKPDDTTTNTEKVEMVWVPESGTKYHSKSTCSGMNSPRNIPLEEAISEGYTACKRCH